jgi:hypothetical protein
MSTAYFDQLGDTVERLWTEVDCNEEHFPEIAARALEEFSPPPEVTSKSLLGDTVGMKTLVNQENAGFGDPPITLYRSRDFYISALYWLDGTTSIHQHAFSGAFRVLEGSSLHCQYRFDEQEMVSRRLLLGDLDLEEAELLKAGETRRIVAGRPFIHSLFHLDRPTVTIVVRTNGESVGTQFNFEEPGVAWDPFWGDHVLSRQLMSLNTLFRLDPDQAVTAVRSLIDRSDVWASFIVLQNWFGGMGRGEQFFDLVDYAVKRHGSVARDLRSMFGTIDRRTELIFRRKYVHDPEQRLFLALLMNLPDAASVTSVLKQAFPDEAPAELIADWLEDLSSPTLQGASGLYLDDDAVSRIRSGLADESSTSATLTALSNELKLPTVLSSLFR